MGKGKQPQTLKERMSRQSFGEYRIYCLSQKSNGIIFYIGMTKNSLKDRLSRHYAAAKSRFGANEYKVTFITDIVKKEDSIEICELCHFNGRKEDALILEGAYINAAKRSGLELLNSYVGLVSRGLKWEYEVFIPHLVAERWAIEPIE